MEITVRPATSTDVEAIAAIYAVEVADGYATFDDTPPASSTWLAKIESSEIGDCFLVACESPGGAVIGFAYSAPYRPRGAYRHTRETTVYVDRGAVGYGVGMTLYSSLIPLLREAGVHTAIAGIALPNEASVGLHESAGFTHLGTMLEVGRKFDRWIDVGWWQLALTSAADRPASD